MSEFPSAIIVYSVNRNSVWIKTKEEHDFTGIVDDIVDEFCESVDEDGAFSGSLDYLESRCLSIARHHFPAINWTWEEKYEYRTGSE